MRPVKNKYIVAGADLGFSRGERGFSKKYSKILGRPKLLFWALPKHYKDPVLATTSAPQAKLWKTGQKRRFRHFLEKVDQKIAIFRRARPLKISIFGAFRKILASVSQKWISQNSTKGGPFGSAWDQIPDKGSGCIPPHPQIRPCIVAWFYWTF